MKLLVEVSMYPLSEKYIPAIDDFIKRLNLHPDIAIWTNDASTQITGEFDLVMEIFTKEIKASYTSQQK